MINPDEFEPVKTKAKLLDLQPMSVEELIDYISSLKDEIVRAENMINKKRAHKDGIEALFGKSE